MRAGTEMKHCRSEKQSVWRVGLQWSAECRMPWRARACQGDGASGKCGGGAAGGGRCSGGGEGGCGVGRSCGLGGGCTAALPPTGDAGGVAATPPAPPTALQAPTEPAGDACCTPRASAPLSAPFAGVLPAAAPASLSRRCTILRAWNLFFTPRDARSSPDSSDSIWPSIALRWNAAQCSDSSRLRSQSATSSTLHRRSGAAPSARSRAASMGAEERASEGKRR